MEAVAMTLKLSPFGKQQALLLFPWIPESVVRWAGPMVMDAYLSGAMEARNADKRKGLSEYTPESFESAFERGSKERDYYSRSLWHTNSYTGEERTIRGFLLSI